MPAEGTAARARIDAVIDVVISVAFVALVAGLIEAVTLGVRLHFFHQFTWSSRHVGWMAPVAYLAFLGAMAAPAVPLAALRPRWPVAAIATAAVVAVASFAVARLVTSQRVHPVALGLVAAALALQAGRAVHVSRASWRRISRVGCVLGLTLVAGWGLGTTAWWRWKERREIAALGQARAGSPNVLLLVLDTVRGENLSLYGYPRPTSPWLDGYAATGVTFEHAFSAAPWTLPSHATMFTGLEPWEHQASFFTALDRSHPTLAEVFRRRGYLTAGFVANHIYANEQTGLERGFIRYQTFPISLRQILLSAELGQMISSQRSQLAIRAADRPRAADINRQLLEWLASRRSDRPFFVFLNYMDAHLPHRVPSATLAKFAAGDAMVDEYDAAVADLDRQLRALFERLEKTGILANTIVVITADHGEHLGDHKMDDHANSLYTQLLRVPLVVVEPGSAGRGRRVEGQVGLNGLAATVAELAGIPDAGLPGPSFAAAIRGDTGSVFPIIAQVDGHPLRRSWFRNATGPMWSAFAEGHHLIENPDGTLELFDYLKDPAERDDLAERADLDPIKTKLRAVLDSTKRAMTSGVR